METDLYVTMTVFQMEKEFGESEEAAEFIKEIIAGAVVDIIIAIKKLHVLEC